MATFDALSCFGALEVTHQTVVPKVSRLIPSSDKDFDICIFYLLLMSFYCLAHKEHRSLNIANQFAMIFHLEYTTYFKMCDQF